MTDPFDIFGSGDGLDHSSPLDPLNPLHHLYQPIPPVDPLNPLGIPQPADEASFIAPFEAGRIAPFGREQANNHVPPPPITPDPIEEHWAAIAKTLDQQQSAPHAAASPHAANTAEKPRPTQRIAGTGGNGNVPPTSPPASKPNNKPTDYPVSTHVIQSKQERGHTSNSARSGKDHSLMPSDARFHPIERLRFAAQEAETIGYTDISSYGKRTYVSAHGEVPKPPHTPPTQSGTPQRNIGSGKAAGETTEGFVNLVKKQKWTKNRAVVIAGAFVALGAAVYATKKLLEAKNESAEHGRQ